MSHPNPLHDPADEAEREQEQESLEYAQIMLSRKTLEKLEFAYFDLSRDELMQVREILKGMRANDGMEKTIVRIGRDKSGNLTYLP
jgi:hypothetical protein